MKYLVRICMRVALLCLYVFAKDDIELFAVNGFPVASDVYCLPISGQSDLLTVLFGHLKPAVLVFTAEVPLDHKVTALINQDHHFKWWSEISPKRAECWLA